LLEALGRARVTHDSYALARQVYLEQLEDPNAAHLVAIETAPSRASARCTSAHA
jgi:hypothetical protein